MGKSVSALDTKAVGAAKAESQKLLKAAHDGGFRISPEGVQPLEQAVAEMQTRLLTIQRRTVLMLSQAPKLGAHEYGHAVAAHDQRSAADSVGSAGTVLKQFSQVLEDLQTALTKAVENYHEAENSAADSVRSS
ncbi:hypothetical protein JHE00_08475 [Prauserella sp. ASG 168]|uniref:Uncharacterized protein n=1 Tax=Prauserella cavernicola TaxID=2800127 RepID=A0A934V3H9_9PSEU|nr:hypothetical protein [Prauserella cavernicola]